MNRTRKKAPPFGRNIALYVLGLFDAAGLSNNRVAVELGIERSTVSRWLTPNKNRPDANIPPEHHVPLLELAQQHGVPLTAQVLVYGEEGAAKKARR